jgi:lipopolysaccharide export system protein LptA
MRLAADGGPTTAAAVRKLVVFCKGDIRVEERKIRFLGRVRVMSHELDAAAPTMTIVADGMEMDRDLTGAVTDIAAQGNVTISSPRLHGTGDTLAVDLRRTLATLSKRRGEATITMDDGAEFRCAQLEVNYTTYGVRGWYGEIEPGTKR